MITSVKKTNIVSKPLIAVKQGDVFNLSSDYRLVNIDGIPIVQKVLKNRDEEKIDLPLSESKIWVPRSPLFEITKSNSLTS